MSQPTYTEVQAVDPVLTNMLVGYKQSADRFVANRVFPVVPVEKQAFTYYTFTKKYWFLDSMIARAPGAQFARSGYGVESTSGACQLWGLEHPIPDEVRANNQTPMALEQARLQWLAHQSLIPRERAFPAHPTTSMASRSTSNAKTSASCSWAISPRSPRATSSNAPAAC